MERLEAKAKISQLIGTDLRPLADKLQVTVKKEDGKINKGWAGHVIERLTLCLANSLKRSGEVVFRDASSSCVGCLLRSSILINS
jgi:hypothetical protein